MGLRGVSGGFGILSLAVTLTAGEALPANTGSLAAHLDQHCVRCHGEKKAKGGLNLTTLLRERPFIKNREQWNHVIDLVEAGEMPPEDEESPTKSERNEILQQLDLALNHFDFSSIDNPGFEEARRLTNQEYNRTISDLFGTPMSPADRFPSDLTGASGFKNSANTLFLQTALMERYIAAAESVVESAIPSKASHSDESETFRRIIVQLPSDSVSPERAANKIFKRFLHRAYRRPPTNQELDQAITHFSAVYQDASTIPAFVEAIKQVIQATLISPKFLLRIEQGSQTPGSYRITDYELASRLSYFLWGTMPDETLFELAASERLHQAEVLESQISRMLNHPYADTLGDSFAAQWLGFGFMGNRVRLDPIDNPWCTDTLMTAMREESGLFFTSIIRENRSIADLVSADYTFLNEELANEIYGREDIKGSAMRRVTHNTPNRGGILTQGSLMAITSNYKDTSPIKRGNWILETVLGRPLPPPPPNAGAFKEDVEEDDSLTFRQKVELHSSDPSCRSCHSKIDPMGFSLENFDYFGRWRDSYRVRVLERNDKEALSLVFAMCELDEDELNERIDELDSGPDERMEIRERLDELRRMDQGALNKEITTNLSISRQNRLIRVLEWLDIEAEDPDWEKMIESLESGVEILRSDSEERIEERIWALDDLEDDERQEIRGYVYEIRSATDEQLADILEDDGEELFELLEFMELVSEGPSHHSLFPRLITALRELTDDEIAERVSGLDTAQTEKEEILEGAKFFRNIPEASLKEFLRHEISEDFRSEVTSVLLEMELLDDHESEAEDRRGRRRFEQKPITAEATLPDGTPFQGPQGLKSVILSNHKNDLTRQLTSKMLAYALGRQLEYFDEAAIRTIITEMESNDYQMHTLVKGIVNSYPFQYKRNPEPKNDL